MKCNTCKADFYPVAYETFYDGNEKYRLDICPYCESENFLKVHKFNNCYKGE